MRRAIYEDDVIKLLDKGWKSGVYPVASNIHALPSAQPEKRTDKRTETHACDSISRQAVKHLDIFTKTYCRDKSVKDDLVFRCNQCDFQLPDGTCLVKTMAKKLCPDYREFGSMGGSIMGDLISRQAAIDYVDDVPYIKMHPNIGLLWKAWIEQLPSAQPELIEKAAYIRGFEQGRTQGMIDSQGEGSRTAGLATDAISRQAAIDAIGKTSDELYENIKKGATFPQRQWFDGMAQAQSILENLPSVQPETNCSEIPNASDFVSRKAVREMVATWAYDLMEQEDLNMALHDVDELPPVSVEREGGKKNEGNF